MTCSKNFGRLLQAGCLALIGMLTVVGCGGSETSGKLDTGVGGEVGPGPLVAALNVTPSAVNFGSVDLGKSGTGTVVVTNTGKAVSGPLSVVPGAGVTATGCAAALGAGLSCTMVITATPTVLGGFSSTVSVSANPGALTPLVISVTGSAVAVGQFSVNPTLIELGNIAVGSAAPKQTITVTASTNLTDLSVQKNGSDVTIDTTSTCSAVLASGASCNVVVNFLAATKGPKSDSILISAGGVNGKSVPVSITANAQNPAALVISPSTPQTLVTSVNLPSSPITFGVANSGDVATGALSVTVTGLNALDFTATPTGCTLLAPLAGCTVTVVFTPKAASTANETAALVVTDTGVGASVATVSLIGTAFSASNLTITPATTDLGSVLVGSTGAATVFTVTNGGDTAATSLKVTLSSTEFFKGNDTCDGATIAKGASCTVSIALKPLSIGVKTANLTIGGTDGLPVGRTLTGTGISPPGLSATPASLDFGTIRVNKSGTAQTVTVKNTGGATTAALSFTKTGQFADFPITASTCSAALPPAGTCTFSVNFAPTGLPGSEVASYTVTDGTVSAPVAVSGTAQASTGLSFEDSSFDDLPSVNVCDPNSPVLPCITDTVIGGGDDITVFVAADASAWPAGTADTGAITVALAGTNAADFVIKENKCTFPLVSGDRCQVTVTFSPTAAGLRQATLNVTSTNGGADALTLQGNGLPITGIYACTGSTVLTAVAPATCTSLSADPKDFDFGQVSLNAVEPTIKNFRVVVRGPTSAAAPFPTNTLAVALNDLSTTGSNFSYPQHLDKNPCTGAVLTVSNGNALGPVTATGGGIWYPSTSLSVKGAYYCDFQVQFLPQGTVKDQKTATLTATGNATGGGADSKTLTGTATGPLTINLASNSASFPDPVTVGDSTNDNKTNLTLISSQLVNPNLTLDVINTSTAVTLGPLTASIPAGDFQIVEDHCTTTSLAPRALCQIMVAFSPTGTPGAKTGTLTVVGSGETATYDLTGNGGTGFMVSLTPSKPQATPESLGSIVEGNVSQWKMFTIKNPAGAPKTNQFTWSLSESGLSTTNPTSTTVKTDHFLVDGAQGTDHPCGQNGFKALVANDLCNIWVQYTPLANDEPGVDARAQLYLEVNGVVYLNSLVAGAPTTFISGTPTSKLTVTSAQATKTIGTVVAYDFKDVAVSADSPLVTLTVNNVSATAITVQQPIAGTTDPFSIVAGGTCAADITGKFSLAASASCTVAVKMTGRTELAVGAIPYQEDPAVLMLFEDAANPGASSASAYLTGNTVHPAALEVVGLPTDTSTVAIDLGSVVNPNQSAPVTLTFQNTGDVPAVNLNFAWDKSAVGDVQCTASADGVTCDPFTVVSETQGCFGLTSLASKAKCSISIKAAPASSTVQGLKILHFTLSADGGIKVSTKFQLQATVRRTDTTATDVYFDYHYPTATDPMRYGFVPFIAATTDVTAVGASSAQIIVLLENKSGGAGTSIALPAADAWNTLVTLPGSATLSGEFNVIPAGSNACSTTLAFNSACTLGVTFKPTSFSPISVFKFASLTVAGNTLGLVGQVKKPANLTITPVALAFGEVLLNASTAGTLTAVVTNDGDVDATAVSVVIDNTDVFGAAGCGTTLVAGASCTLTVTAVPNTLGLTTSALRIGFTGGAAGATNSSPMGPVVLTVTGVTSASLVITGSGLAVVNANAKSYDFAFAADGFATMVVGSTVQPEEKLFTITNSNTQTSGALDISLAGNTDSFTLDFTPDADVNYCKKEDGTFVTLGATENCVIGIVFQPISHKTTTATPPGDVATTLTVKATPGATVGKTVAVTAHSKSALDFYASSAVATPLVSPANVIATGYGTDIYVKLYNNSVTDHVAGPTAMLSTAGLSGADAASFLITQNTCLLNQLWSTTPNNVCIISVQYVGGATTTAKTTSLSVSDGMTGNSNSITVQYGP